MDNIDLGVLGEQLAILELTRQGWMVFMPIHHNTRIDLIATKGDSIRKIQVKTTTECQNSAIPLYLKKTHLNPKYDYTYQVQDFDYFCLVEPNKGVVIFVKSEEALQNKRQMYFSLTEVGSRKASDYRMLE